MLEIIGGICAGSFHTRLTKLIQSGYAQSTQHLRVVKYSLLQSRKPANQFSRFNPLNAAAL